MASQVLSGTGNISYTNTTGKNIRLIINFMSGSNIRFSWGNSSSLASSESSSTGAFGKSAAYSRFMNIAMETTLFMTGTSEPFPVLSNFSSPYTSKNFAGNDFSTSPIEYILAPNHVFSTTGTVAAYNILTITED